jgi:histidinol-phosphate aminotransferase
MKIAPRRALLNTLLQRPDPLLSEPREANRFWLDKNENLDPYLAERLKKILSKTPISQLMTYPETGYLYKKIASLISVEPNQLLLTPGSDGAIRMVFDAMIEAGDVVVHTAPTFAMYPVYSLIYGADAKKIEYKRFGSEILIDIEEMFYILRSYKPKLLCLPNPDSPTGTIITPDVLKKILIECENLGTLLLIDEAYHPFYNWSAVSWCKDYENLVVARTFAKAWGVAGLRAGYLVAHPSTAALLHKLKSMYEVNTLAVDFISRLLDYSDEMEESVARVGKAKSYFAKEMELLGFNVLPTQANFLHVAFGDFEKVINQELSDKVYYRRSFDSECLKGYSRFTIGPMSVMEEVVALIKKGMVNRAE